MSQIISSRRRTLAKDELLSVVRQVWNNNTDTQFVEAEISVAVDHICDAVHEEIRGWLRAEGVIE